MQISIEKTIFTNCQKSRPLTKRVKEIDSLQRKKYGFFVESTGCIIYEEDKYYNEAVDEYLQKKNGKNWENQYEKEVALIIKKYPIKEIER